MSVGDLWRAVLEGSDNTAAVLLMRSAGGPCFASRCAKMGDCSGYTTRGLR
ncbi:serine hydrolase [Caballeronia insecticola]|uniref:serine hydrolase n=1 Tax=Caballeronia insecticola TaxID=758793 RepID=UPI001E298CBE|nr:serine hydrolase [Caballeronia insecticola]